MLTKYNPDQHMRDKLVLGHRMKGNIEWYSGLDAKTLAMLIKERFADPEETQNESPTIAAFLEFMQAHPWAMAHGYLVGAPRDDYRVSVEGLAGKAPTAAEAQAFKTFCKYADELSGRAVTGGRLRAWWD